MLELRLERMGHHLISGRTPAHRRYGICRKAGNEVATLSTLQQVANWIDEQKRVDRQRSFDPILISDRLPIGAYAYDATQRPDGRWVIQNIQTTCPVEAQCSCGSGTYWVECKTTPYCESHHLPTHLQQN